MKKLLFGREKQREQAQLQPPVQQTPQTTPIHQQFATTVDDERWEMLEHGQGSPPLPPGASAPSPTRAPSPYTASQNNTLKPNQPPAQTLRKKTPPVLGILHSLDPVPGGHVRNKSEERDPPKKQGGGFWGRGDKEKERERAEAEARDRDRDREREHQQAQQNRGRERREEENELTRKIGFLTATASEDWTLVLDVCDHASATEANAKEAVRALRREFKYGEPAAQLAAARLWAIMLRNSSDTFINQSTARKFLDTLEDLLTSSRTAPVVRERVMDVLAAAAYASGSKKDTGFRGLWRRVKPRDKPEEGMPFDTEDAMFNPPQTGAQRTITAFDYDSNTVTVNPNAVRYDSNATPPIVTYQDATPTVPDTPPIPRPPARKRKTSETLGTGGGERDRDRDRERGERERGERGDRERRDGERGERGERERGERPEKKGKRRDPKQTGIIPPEEDMRRLFTECAVGVGNANLLSQALAMATPEELEDTVITEFHKKCIDSQELIFTQIPWASAGAERSRAAKDLEERELARTRKTSANTLASINGNGSLPDLGTPVSTREEELLADLLAANEQLLEALKVYDDLKRVALEREVEDRSRGEVRLDPRLRQYITEDGTLHADVMNIGGSGPSRSRSPSPARTAAATPIPMPAHVPMQHPLPSHPSQLEHGVAPYQPPLSQQPSQIQQQHVHGQPPPQTLAPPPAAPHGPRLPTAGGARTPSPAHPDLLVAAGLVGAGELANGTMRGAIAGGRSDYVYAGSNGRGSLDDSVDTHAHGYREAPYRDYNSDDDDDLDPDTRTHQPSAKALGKRKVEVDPYDLGQPLDDESSLGHKDHFDDRPLDSDDENDHTTPERFWTHQLPAPHFVYDAAAERTQARIRQGHVSALIVNGVH